MVKKVEYSRKINSSHLILTVEEEGRQKDTIDCIEMFYYNVIPNFLRMHVQVKGSDLQYYYNITGKCSLEQTIECRPLGGLLLKKILVGFDRACMQVGDHMLSESDIVLIPELVFLDNETEHLSYCYVPGYDKDICTQFREFMEFMLQHLDHKDEYAVQLAYGVYQKVAEETASLHIVLQEIDKNEIDIFDGRNGNKQHMEKAGYGAIEDIAAHEKNDEAGYEVKNRPEHEIGDTVRHGTDIGLEAKTDKTNKKKKIDKIRSKEAPRKKMDLYKDIYNSTNRDKDTDQDKDTNKDMDKYINRGVDRVSDHPAAKWLHSRQDGKEKNNRENNKKQKNEAEKNESKRNVTEKNGSKRNVAEKNGSKRNVTEENGIKKQVCWKLKNLLRKKIYTERFQGMDIDMDPICEPEGEEGTLVAQQEIYLPPESDDGEHRFIYQGDDRSRDFSCIKKRMILGSSKQDSDVYIPYPMISKVHAKIEVGAEETFLEDMNSTNGTHVNGELLQYRERRTLKKGDIISLAGETYCYH